MARFLIILAFSAQALWMFVQQSFSTRYFSWSMYHTWCVYEFTVDVNSHRLSAEEFISRYKFKMNGNEGRSIQHKINQMKKYETLYGKESVKVWLAYTENGVKKTWERQWLR